MKKPTATTDLTMKSLGYSVIGDIKRATHDALYSRLTLVPEYVDYKSLKECLTALVFWEEQLKSEKNYNYIGPEMFRWLAFFSDNLKKGNIVELSHQFLELPELVFIRVLPYQSKIKKELSFTVRLPFAAKGIRFIQLGEVVEENFDHNGLIEIKLNKNQCTLSSLSEDHSLDVKNVLNKLDGYRKEKKYWIVSDKVFLHQEGIPLNEMIYELNQIASGPVADDQGLAVIEYEDLFSEKYENILKNLDNGYKYIKKYSMAIYNKTCDSLKGITLLRGKRFVGSSDIWYHGIAVLNPDDSWSEITFSDHLIHESAHTILHKINELDPILLNPFDMLNLSPIRKDPRPIYGTLHATYVFMNLAKFFESVEKSISSKKGKSSKENKEKPLDSNTEEVLFRLNRHIKGFYDGMEILAEYALFTPFGYNLFEEMNTYREALIKRHPSPDYTQYQNASNDYVI